LGNGFVLRGKGFSCLSFNMLPNYLQNRKPQNKTANRRTKPQTAEQNRKPQNKTANRRTKPQTAEQNRKPRKSLTDQRSK
jgi:hypothetical protein